MGAPTLGILSGFRPSRRGRRALMQAMRNAGRSPSDQNPFALVSDINERDIKGSCAAATTAALAACTYDNGPADDGIGATLTENANGALGALDGITLVVGDRLLVKNQVAGLQNGIYVVTQVGSASLPWILTRASDCDSSDEFSSGMLAYVEAGTVNGGQWFTVSTVDPITVGTTAVAFNATPPTGGATLAVLASNANGEGASLIGIEDTSGYFSDTDLEAVLADVGERFAAVNDTTVLAADADTLDQAAHTGGDSSVKTAFATTKTLPALAVGDRFQIKHLLYVVSSNGGAQTCTYTVEIDGTPIAIFSSLDPANTSYVALTVDLTVHITGAGGVVGVAGISLGPATTDDVAYVGAVDLSGARTVTITATWSADNAAHDQDLREFSIVRYAA